LVANVAGRVGAFVAGEMASQGLRTAAVISTENAEQLLMKYGMDAERAKSYVASFDGPMTARIVRPGEEFLRYTDVPTSTGSFLTKTEFATPAQAVDGLYLGPYGNSASYLQQVTARNSTIVLEGAIANGGQGIKQLVVNRNAFEFNTGVRY
jgi:hypothetical protein